MKVGRENRNKRGKTEKKTTNIYLSKEDWNIKEGEITNKIQVQEEREKIH